MRTSAEHAPIPFAFSFRASSLACLIVAVAMLLSSIVFSEPAVADGLMLIAIVALPVLGAVRFGNAALLNYAMWLALVALGAVGAHRGLNEPAESMIQPGLWPISQA